MADSTPPDAMERRRASLLVGPLVVLTVAGMVGVAFSPVLLVHHPLALIALNPIWRHLVLASPSLHAGPFFAVAVLRLFAGDPFAYVLGRRYGPWAVKWVEAQSGPMGRLVRRVERIFARGGLVVLFAYPTIGVCALAGAAGIRPVTFVVVDLVGTVAWVALIRTFGDIFAGPIGSIRDYVDDHTAAITLVTVAFAVVATLASGRRAAAAGAAPPSDPRAPEKPVDR